MVSRGDLSLFPPTQGASVKLYFTAKFLSLLGHKVFFVTAENKKYFEVENGVFKEKKYPVLIAESHLTNAIRKTLLKLGIPSDIHVLYHPLINFKLWFKTLYVTLKEKVDILQAEFTAFAIPVIFTKLLTGIPVSLVEHNVESFQLPEITKLEKRGKRLIEFMEKLSCRLCDFIIVIIKEEKDRLKNLGVDENKIYVIPHGVELSKYKKLNGKKIREKYNLKHPTLIFHGALSYKPNRDAVRIIAKKILPKLEKKIKFHVLIIGDSPPSGFNNKNMIFTGAVKNLQDYIDAADVAIVPLKVGGGLRMKILEYFAAKKPVISTEKGAEGISVKNGKEIIIAKIDDFPSQIIKLIKSRKIRDKMTKNAFKFVQAYDWRLICEEYIKLYSIIIKD
jgi:glycosyltransferase involved in cell wall biosynthesis